MKALHYSLTLTLPLLACAIQPAPAQPAPQAVRVQYRTEHPAYLHALSDLRGARWLLSHRPGDLRVTVDEEAAVDRINEGINEIKRAAFDDGKNLDDHPPVDQRLDGRGRLNRAMELLRKARNDIAREEDYADVRGLRDRAIRHIDEAIHATDLALRDASRNL